MKTSALCVLAFVAVAMFSLPLSAGLTYPNRVYVSDTYVSGGVKAAFAAPNSVEAIQCYVFASATSVSGQCMGADASGTTRYCSTSNAAMIDNMRMVGPASYIVFSINAGACTDVRVYNGSQEM